MNQNIEKKVIEEELKRLQNCDKTPCILEFRIAVIKHFFPQAIYPDIGSLVPPKHEIVVSATKVEDAIDFLKRYQKNET